MSESVQIGDQNAYERTLSEHIGSIFNEGELVSNAVVRNFRTTASDGKSYDEKYYHLDIIVSVGCRIKSQQGTQFRLWATQRLKEYTIKGFALTHNVKPIKLIPRFTPPNIR